jgi:hypothetical protein
VNPQMHASTSHVSGSKYITDSGTTSCNIDRWNFTDLADKGRPSKCGLPNWNYHHSESIPFQFIHWGGSMNAGSIFTILILTTEVAYTCRGVERQPHIALNMRCDCLCPSMTIMALVHSMHQLCMCLKTRRVNRRQLKQDISIKGWWKELHPLDVKTVEIKNFEYVPSSL